MILVELDSNTILSKSMKNRISGEMIQVYQALVDRLKECGIKPKQHLFDNKYSEEFKKVIKENDMTYQLVPPNNHMRNSA